MWSSYWFQGPRWHQRYCCLLYTKNFPPPRFFARRSLLCGPQENVQCEVVFVSIRWRFGLRRGGADTLQQTGCSLWTSSAAPSSWHHLFSYGPSEGLMVWSSIRRSFCPSPARELWPVCHFHRFWPFLGSVGSHQISTFCSVASFIPVKRNYWTIECSQVFTGSWYLINYIMICVKLLTIKES